MYKVWIKRNYREIHSIDEGTYKIVFKNVMECKLVNTILWAFYHYFACPYQYCEFLYNSFLDSYFVHTMEVVFHACASRLLMGCTYNKWNGKKCLIWLYHNNQTTICQSLFWNVIHTLKDPVDTSSTYIFIGWNICYGWIKFCPFGCQKYGFSSHTGEFDDLISDSEISSKFEPRKHIDLHMWCQLWVNLILGY